MREKLSSAGLDYNKTAIELAVMNDPNLPATILRLPATHGPGDDKHRLFPYIKRMDDGRPAILLDEAYASWRWSRGYVEDVAHAIVLAVTDERAAGPHLHATGARRQADHPGRCRTSGRDAAWPGVQVRSPESGCPAPVDEWRLRSPLRPPSSPVKRSEEHKAVPMDGAQGRPLPAGRIRRQFP